MLKVVTTCRTCPFTGVWRSQPFENGLPADNLMMSTEDGNGEMILEKWKSLANHIHNKHRGHGALFKKCQHGRLRRKWLKYRKLFWLILYVWTDGILYFIYCIDTKPSEHLLPIINNKSLCNDIMKLSCSSQTSCLESFHSLINHFAPKHTAFSYLGMNARLVSCQLHDCLLKLCTNRLQLAAIHYNYNSNWVQATTKKGEKRYNVIFPKYKKGGHIVREIKTETNFGENIVQLLCNINQSLNVLIFPIDYVSQNNGRHFSNGSYMRINDKIFTKKLMSVSL